MSRISILSALLSFLSVISLGSTKTFGQDSAKPAEAYRLEKDVPYRELAKQEKSEASEYMMERCKLDIYTPSGKTDFATVVWFHGGGLTGGNKSIPERLKEKGIGVVAANYRLSPKASSPEYIEDAAAAVAWTFKNIERYGGSRKRIFVSGHSAGGYLTSMIGLEKKWLERHELDANDIAGLIPFSGQTITHFTIRKERGIDDKQPIIDNMAPIFHIRKDAPPILFLSGDREKELLGRYEETAYMWRMLKVIGHPNVELFELQGYDHGGMADPGFPLLLQFMQRIGKGN